jgi:cellulose synthase/poly-beta-1,6-N-acetylglucosamine synthase-like glycosyltransferase
MIAAEKGSGASHSLLRVAPHESRLYRRLVVVLVLTLLVVIGVYAYFVGRYFAGYQAMNTPERVHVGWFDPLVAFDAPPWQLVALAVASMLLIGLSAVVVEVVATLMTVNPRRTHLSERRAEARHYDAGPVRVTALVPAHNEEASIPETLAALGRQSRPPDRVVVIADNCTDTTVDIARAMGHEVFETVGNTHKKGGALNQVLVNVLPTMAASDVVLVIDADTKLSTEFIEVAAERMEADGELGAVGGVFYGDPGHGLVGQFQRNEYTRYALQLRARRGRVFVLTGTASMFRTGALLDVAAARGIVIPGEPGQIYDTAAMTEDNELTLALKSLGTTMTSPTQCRVTTEIMPDWSHLWVQRRRWQRGALENLSAYGITRATLRYWGQQVGIAYGALALNLAIVLMFITAVSVDEWIWFPFWTAVGLMFLAERVITVWAGGWRARILAVTLIPELCYDVFLQVVFMRSLLDIVLDRAGVWGHVNHNRMEVHA